MSDIDQNSVYTTGPGSTAAGLTASLRKVGEEMVIDRGLLILADQVSSNLSIFLIKWKT